MSQQGSNELGEQVRLPLGRQPDRTKMTYLEALAQESVRSTGDRQVVIPEDLPAVR